MKTTANGSVAGTFKRFIYPILRLIRDVTFVTFTLLCHIPLVYLFLVKFTVTFVATRLYKDLTPMNSGDYLMAVSLDVDIEDSKSQNLNGNLGITCKLNGKVDGESFFKTFVNKVINIDYSKPLDPNDKHIRFHKSITRFWGYWFFKTFPNQLKFEDHVTCATLPNNSSYEEEISKWLKIRYDIKKCPLWGILVLYREESHDTIFAFKIHHLLADGYSLLHILDLLTNTKYKYQVRDFNESKWEKFKIMVKATFKIFINNIKLAFVPKSPLCQKDYEIFITNLTVPLSFVKNIRHESKVRFQSVMLYFTLNYLYSLITNVKDDESIPKKIVITNSLPWPNHPRTELCNHAVGAMFVFEKEKKKTTPKEVLQNVNEIFEEFQENHLDRAGFILTKPLSLIPLFPFRFCKSVALGMMEKISCCYIHLIGSEEYLQVFDIECSDVRLFCLPPQQRGLTVTCLTTSNEVRLTVMGPKSIFPSQEKAAEYSQENFQRIITELSANHFDSHWNSAIL